MLILQSVGNNYGEADWKLPRQKRSHKTKKTFRKLNAKNWNIKKRKSVEKKTIDMPTDLKIASEPKWKQRWREIEMERKKSEWET